MKLRWQLSTQFLVLVSIPVIFQIAAFSWLIDLQHRTEPLLSKLSQALAVKADIAIALSDMIRICIEADYGREVFLLSPEFDETRRDASERAKHIMENGGPAELLALARTLNDLVDDAKDRIMSTGIPPTHDEFFKLKEQADPLLERSIKMPPILMQLQTNATNVILDRLQNDEQQYERILDYSMLIETLLIGVSLFLLSNNIRTRFTAAIGNAYKLASNRQLNPPVGGSDEISQIDSAFHAMATRLIEAESNAKIIGEHARAVICALNEKLAFVAASGASSQLFGYAPDELLHLKVAELLMSDDVADPVAQFEQLKFQNVQLLECRCLRKDSSKIDTEWSVYWSSEAHIYFCTVHDTTASKEAERLRRELIQLVSNDLQTPLGSIATILSQLQSDDCGQLSEKGTTLLSRAKSATTQMITLVKDLLDLERLEAGLLNLRCQNQPLRALIEQSIYTVSGVSASFDVTVTTDANSTTEIFADGDRIIQVLVNLLTNAIKFSPSGSAVLVSANETTSATCFSVIDRGRGIPANLLSAVFERFRQTQVSDARQKGGSGLGLAICKALVELHGGTITVSSTEANGTTFTVSIPKQEPSKE